MQRLTQLPDLVPSAEVRVNPVIINHPVAVVVRSITDSRPVIPYPFIHGRQPHSADSHVFQIVQFLNEAEDVASPEAAVFHLGITVTRKTVHRVGGIRVLWIYVRLIRVMWMKTVHEGNVDGSASIILAFAGTSVLGLVLTPAVAGSRA